MLTWFWCRMVRFNVPVVFDDPIVVDADLGPVNQRVLLGYRIEGLPRAEKYPGKVYGDVLCLGFPSQVDCLLLSKC